jgi:hypothetical protein
MKLYEYPTVNKDLRDLSLREQVEARLRQIDVSRYYSDKSISGMSDYALLTAFEVMVMGIGRETAEESFNEGFDAGIAYGMEKVTKSQNETFTMKEGELIASSRDFK